jgi:hypothetical protein
MKKYLKYTIKISAIITFSLIIFSSSAGFILAQSNNIDYVPLAPLPGTTKDQCSGSGNALDMLSGSNDCTTNFATYLPGAFNFIVGLSAVLAFVVLTYGGVLYMTSDAINNKKEGRKYIENALWGLGLVLASYVILYTINPQILSFKLKLVQPETSNQSPDILSALAASTAAGTPVTGQAMTQAQIAASNQIAALLGQTANPCTQGQTTNCVNFNGLQQNTITGLQSLSNLCGKCTITITGGTEAGHSVNSSHDNGTAVDIADTQTLSTTIDSNFTQTSQNSDGSCPVWTDSAGNTYLYEQAGDLCGGTTPATGAPHWHITYK